MKTVFEAFDVIPAVNKLVVVTELAVYRLLVKASEFKFEIAKTLRIPTFAVVAERLVVKEFKFEIAKTLRVPTFAVVAATEFRFEIPETFRVSIEAP